MAPSGATIIRVPTVRAWMIIRIFHYGQMQRANEDLRRYQLQSLPLWRAGVPGSWVTHPCYSQNTTPTSNADWCNTAKTIRELGGVELFDRGLVALAH